LLKSLRLCSEAIEWLNSRSTDRKIKRRSGSQSRFKHSSVRNTGSTTKNAKLKVSAQKHKGKNKDSPEKDLKRSKPLKNSPRGDFTGEMGTRLRNTTSHISHFSYFTTVEPLLSIEFKIDNSKIVL
jgi:hypothetical protein